MGGRCKGVCSIEHCDRPNFSRGWCQRHWTRWMRHGNPTEPVDHLHDSFERMCRYVEPTGFCWNWIGSLHHTGYGETRKNGRSYRAHRWMYEELVGPIPSGKVLDHLCRNKRCVNPDHLEPVSIRENTIRGRTSALRPGR